MNRTIHIIILIIISVSSISCIPEIHLQQHPNNPSAPQQEYTSYLYNFADEVQNPTAEITIQTNNAIDATALIADIPYLKYNKSLLIILTQDDCKQAAYCRTWAVINGKPVSSSETYPTQPLPHDLYYDAAQLAAKDLPPTIITANEPLCCSDGAGNDVRFAITTTLIPEKEWMNAITNVSPGYSNNYYRFYMKSGLIWNNVREMLNYGCGIAFHDVLATDDANPDDILTHLLISQDSIIKRLSGRGCKMLAEPNGNKTYITAASKLSDIQTMVAQSQATTLYPFKTDKDIKGLLVNRVFSSPEQTKQTITEQMNIAEQDRAAINIGVHGTDNSWTTLLRWIGDTYGKRGSDVVWFPSQEEYYEYTYYRAHSTITITQVNDSTIKLVIHIPTEKFFYYPSISINVIGISSKEVVSVSANDVVTGLSYGEYNKGLTFNIDCRKHLAEHARHYVEKYQNDKSDLTALSDALYFR